MPVDLSCIEAVFSEALEIPDGSSRAEYLDRACEGDAELRKQVESLLAMHGRAGRFLESPAVGTEDQPSERPGTSIGPYRLMETIGEGGMGVVHVAEQTEPVRRKVALKVIKPGMDTKQVIARFEAERQALAMMDHPNIARVLDAGATESGRPYFVMELVRGIPITEYCDRERLTIEDRLELLVLVCRAVQHAHQKGIIHRDLKPSNILVTVIDGAAVPKIIDFGIAKATGASLTERTIYTGFHQFLGTPLYMSPEQAELSGVDVDTRSDIYSLGVLLYELLTGTTPFSAETLRRAAFDEVRRILREEEPPKPSTRLSSLGKRLSTVSERRKADPRRLGTSMKGELDWIVMKALEKDRHRRYETANDFAADVMNYLDDRPVEACPPSAVYRLRKQIRRNLGLMTTAAVVFLALVSGVGVATWQAFRALRAERKAESRYAVARRAVDDMYTQVAEDWLAQQAERDPLQREFLEKALAYYEQFAAEVDADPAARFDAVQARRRVAAIQVALGQLDPAAASFRRALGEVEALTRSDPGHTEYDRELGRVLDGLCSLLCDRGDFPAAEPLLSRALTLREDLVARDTCNLDDRADLAETLSIQGSVFLSKNELVQAEPIYRRCLDLYRALTVESQVKATVRGNLAKVEVLLGLVAYRNGKLSEAEEAFRHAIVVSESLLAERPTDPDRRLSLGFAIQKLANVLSDQRRRVESLTQYERVEEILSRLVAEFPNRSLYRVELLGCLRGKMMALIDAEAVEAVARHAVTLAERYAREEHDLRHYRAQLATFLAFLAQAIRDRDPRQALTCLERALTLRERLCTEFPEEFDYRRDLCALYGQLAMNHALGPPGDPLFDPAAAMNHASRLVSMLPDEPSVKVPLAWALYRQGDWARCIKELENIGPESYDYFLAMAYWRLGDEARARRIVDLTDADVSRMEAQQSWDPTIFPDPAAWRRIRVEAATLMGLGPNPYTMPNGVEAFSR